MFDLGWRFATAEETVPEQNMRPDPIHPTYTHLSQLYLAQDPDYSGRYTVPLLYDTKTDQIVSNESSEILRMLYTEFDELLPAKYAEIDLFPADLRKNIEVTNEWTYHDINNGVYKCGASMKQEAYEGAVKALFAALDRAEAHLASSPGPFYYGSHITEADVRLYVTVVRFDPVYHQHFKCNIRDIRSGYPALHRWLRRLYWGDDAFQSTTDFEQIKNHYTKSHLRLNPAGITALGPLPRILGPREEVAAVKAANCKMQAYTVARTKDSLEWGGFLRLTIRTCNSSLNLEMLSMPSLHPSQRRIPRATSGIADPRVRSSAATPREVPPCAENARTDPLPCCLR